MEKFSELIKNLSDVPKSDDFVYFTKIAAAIWSISEIIPASIPCSTKIELKIAFTGLWNSS